MPDPFKDKNSHLDQINPVPSKKEFNVDNINQQNFTSNPNNRRRTSIETSLHLSLPFQHQSTLLLSDEEIKKGEWAHIDMLNYDPTSSAKFCANAEEVVSKLTQILENDFQTKNPGTLKLEDYLSILKNNRRQVQKEKETENDRSDEFGEERYEKQMEGYNTHVARYANETYEPIINTLTLQKNKMGASEADKQLLYSESFINPTYSLELSSKDELNDIYSNKIPKDLEFEELANGKIQITMPLSTLKLNWLAGLFTIDLKDTKIKSLLWAHPSPMYIPLIKHEVGKQLNKIHKEVHSSSQSSSKLNEDLVLESVGKIHWLMSQFPFYSRGTAAIAHQFTQSILRSVGFRPTRVPQGTSPDVTALLTYVPKNFINMYKLGHMGPVGLFQLPENL